MNTNTGAAMPQAESTLKHAERLLREAAAKWKDGISINGVPDWQGEPETAAAYQESCAVADALAALSAAAPAVAPFAWVPPEREGQHHAGLTITAYREPMAGWVPVYLAAPTAPQAQQPGAAEVAPSNDCRAEFEAWAKFDTAGVTFDRGAYDQYNDFTAALLWHAWGACWPVAQDAARAGAQAVPSDAETILSKVCDLFHIGKLARTESTILTNVENVIRFTSQLRAVERELFPQPDLPEDDDPYADVEELPAPNSWGARDEADYVAQFRTALAARAAAPAAVSAPSVPADVAKDAARYRWLRDVSVPPHNFYLSVPDEFKDERYTRAEVDSAIDAAMLAAAPQAPAGEGGAT